MAQYPSPKMTMVTTVQRRRLSLCVCIVTQTSTTAMQGPTSMETKPSAILSQDTKFPRDPESRPSSACYPVDGEPTQNTP